MKIVFKSIIVLFVVGISAQVGWTQNWFTQKYKEGAIHRLCELMNDFYVFPEIAKETEVHLLQQLKDGHFDQFKSDEDFAKALTLSVQSINKDKHMLIRANKKYEEPENSPEQFIAQKLDQINNSRKWNAGFNKVEVLEGNVGYLDLRGFARMERGKPLADAYMKLISKTDAVIIDLSENGGGSPPMVQYLCSYFFDEPVHLNSLYWREGDQTQEFWSLKEVGGLKMIDIPLFVITGERTFSGAEEFSYNMQTQKRATLIGQTTRGGANPGNMMPINQNLAVFIPTGKAINPITKTNWEGVGVVPEIKTSKEETLEKTHQLAKKAAEEYRSNKSQQHKSLFVNLSKALNMPATSLPKEDILKSLKQCHTANLLGEGDINM